MAGPSSPSEADPAPGARARSSGSGAALPMLAASVCAAVAQAFFKRAAVEIEPMTIGGLLGSGFVWLGVASYGASLPLSLLGYQRGDLLVSFPLLSLSYVWTAIAGVLLFDEVLGPRRIAAIALLIVGAAALGSRP